MPAKTLPKPLEEPLKVSLKERFYQPLQEALWSRLHPQPWPLNPKPGTLDPKPSTLTPKP